MDTKLKKLNNPKVKYISLFGAFIFIGYLIKTIYNLKYLKDTLNNLEEAFISMQKHYIFGNMIDINPKYVADDFSILAAILVLGAIISIALFYISRNSSYKMENKINEILSKIPFEIIIVIIISTIIIRNIFFNKYYMGYFVSTYMDIIILFLAYAIIQALIMNKGKLQSKLMCNIFIKDLIDKNNKKSLNKKIVRLFTASIAINFIVSLVIMEFFLGMHAFLGIAFTTIIILSTALSLVYIYQILSEKFSYIDYISENITIIENGNLKHKLEVKGNDEISNLANSINNISNGLDIALANMVKSEKMKTELITNVSHDLKTPLTSIVNYVDILKNNDLDIDTMKDYILILDKKSQRLKTLVEDILEASKISSGDVELNLEKTDIKELLIQSIVELEDQIEESKLEFVIDTPEHQTFTNIDGKRIYRVFENLINNILKYSLQNTRVYIDMYVEEENVNITFKNISNHKLNIKPEELLERFRRGDVSRNTDGSGLGLSIAQNLVNLNGGDMKLDIDGDLFKVNLKFIQI